MLAVLFCPVDMGSDNSSLLPTSFDGLKDHILFFGENEMHAAYPVHSIKAFRSVNITLKLKNINSFPLVLQNCARVGFGALMSSPLDERTSQVRFCCQSCFQILTTVQCWDCYKNIALHVAQSVPREELWRPQPRLPPPTITMIKVLIIKFQKCFLFSILF